MSTLPSRPLSLPTGTGILLVDDDPSVRAVAADFFDATFSDCDVVTAENGRDGLDLAGGQVFDCIVLDYDMLEINGIEVLQRLRSRGDSTPVVLYTGTTQRDIQGDVFTYSAADYLQKGSRDAWERLTDRIIYAVSTYRQDWWGQQAEHFFGDSSDTEPQCLWMFDGMALNTIHLRGFEELWGLPGDRVRDDPREVLEFVVGDDQERVADAIEALTGGQQVTVDYRIQKNGQLVPLRSQGVPIIENGAVSRIFGVTKRVGEGELIDQRTWSAVGGDY